MVAADGFAKSKTPLSGSILNLKSNKNQTNAYLNTKMNNLMHLTNKPIEF